MSASRSQDPTTRPLPGAPADRGGATLANWRTSPFHRWAFQHAREIMPTADIPAATNPLALRHEPRSLDGLRITTSGAELDLEQLLRATHTDAFAIVHAGTLIYEHYDHGMTARTPHVVMSSTKSVVGLVVGILCERGQLDVTAPVDHYVPELAASAYRGAAIQHLLDMRVDMELSAADHAAYQAATGWDPLAPGQPDRSLHDYLVGLTAPAKPHGGPFRYLSANTDLLGWVIERATGRRFAELVSELLWQPMGAEHPAYITVDRAGAPRCTGGLCATLRDFARLGQLLVQGGRRDGVAIVPEAWLDDTERNGDPDAWRTGEFAPGFRGLRMRYRNHWYVIDDEPRMLFAMGIHGQNLFVDRANQIVIAKLSSQAAPIAPAALDLIHRAIPQIVRHVATGT